MVRPYRLVALALALLALGYALWTNRQGYALFPNLLAALGAIGVALAYRRR